MKKIYCFSFILSVLLSGCEYDNYDPPKSALTGRLVYEDTPIGIRQGIDVLQLYEPGWQTYEPINVEVKQDGSFSSLLFNGSYKLVPIEGNGPFVVSNTDTLDIEVTGEATIDMPVEPYFIIEKENISLNGNTLEASFDIEQINEDSTLDNVAVFVGETVLVDNQFNIETKQLDGTEIDNIEGQITINIDLSEVEENPVFVRIGVKAQESAEYLFTQLEKVER